METIQALTLSSQITLYVLLGLIGLFTLLVFGWQIMILRGKTVDNPDGSSDGYRQQKTHYGIAFADVFLACPLSFLAIALIFLLPRWGFYLLAMVSFWFMWANLMGTVTSLKFEKPKLTLNWWVVFPTGGFVGLAYSLWTIIHFDIIYIL